MPSSRIESSGSKANGWPVASEAVRYSRGSPSMVSPFTPSAPISVISFAMAAALGRPSSREPVAQGIVGKKTFTPRR